jgi:hypothetical protein
MKKSLVVLACFLALSSVPGFAAERTWYQPNRAQWVNDGLILGWGNHESFIFRVRRGGNLPYDLLWQEFLNEHKESNAIEAKKAGIEVYHTHGYKGFGYEAEKKEMEMLKELSGYVHKQGMKLDTYCQVMSLMPENFFLEAPQAKDWVQRDELGRPIMLSYDLQQNYRYKPNLAHPDYRKYYKEKIIKTLVQDCKSDLLHFDNFDNNAEPESDHSPVAVEAFRSYLKKKYTPQQQIERFGHTNMDLIDPPIWNLTGNPKDMTLILDPVQQEWVDFRCWLMADWLKDVTGYARTLNPNIAFDTNPHGLFGRNRAFQAGLWHPWFMKYTEVMWSEESNAADYTDWGVLVSKIRSYKLGRTLDNFVLTYKGSALMLAEGLAFNQTLGNVELGGRREASEQTKYYEFYKANRDLFTGTRNREDAALLRSYATMAYDNRRAELDQCMFEQAMIQRQVPFDLIFDEQMDNLSRYKVLVLAGQNQLSPEHVQRIARFVKDGGGLVVTGATSTRDQWVRRLPRPGLADVLGIDPTWQRSQGWEGEPTFSNKTEISTSGRVVYIPDIVPPDKKQAETWTGSWDGNLWEGTWILPANTGDLAQAVRQAAGGRLSLEVEAPDWVAVEQVQKDNRVMVHLVNYRSQNTLSNLPVDVRLDAGKSVSSVRVVSPDREGSQELKFSVEGGRCRFSVPELKIYDVIVVTQG